MQTSGMNLPCWTHHKQAYFTLDLHTWWIYDDLLTNIDYIAGACTQKNKIHQKHFVYHCQIKI